MNVVLEFEHVSLSDSGPTMSLQLGEGQCLAFMGLTRSGKSDFLSAIAGNLAVARGHIQRHQPLHSPAFLNPVKRTKVQSLALAHSSPRDPAAGERITEALDALGLWHSRKLSLADLTDHQLKLASLMPTLIDLHPLICLDQTLDCLDPYTLERILSIFKKRLKEGSAVVMATNNADIAAHADLICILHSKQIHFVGTVQDVIEASGPTIVTVSAERHSAVKALVEPFAISVTEMPNEVKFEAANGQAMAARLLLEGYGNVRYTVIRRPTFRDAAARILAQTKDPLV